MNNICTITNSTNMFYFFIIAVAVALSIDLFQMGSITSFFQKKITRADTFKLVGIAGTLPIIFILFGWLAGKSLISMLSEQSSWYAASVFFLLSLKSLFDGFKLKPMKKSINPIDIKGITDKFYNNMSKGKLQPVLQFPDIPRPLVVHQ